VVRRDVVGNQPEIAKRLLGEAIRRVIADRLTADTLIGAARRARVSPADPEAFAAFVVARTLAAALDVLAGSDRLRDASPRLPGWELVERAPARRRVRLVGDDLA
jgi:hypothetical protein